MFATDQTSIHDYWSDTIQLYYPFTLKFTLQLNSKKTK